MELMLWRHAQAEGEYSDSADDVLRPLTPHGQHQAQRMATWLQSHLPAGTRILVSPALRCESTVEYLGRKYKLCNELLPSSTLEDMLKLISWPDRDTPTLLVGHQPGLGQLAAHLLGMKSKDQSIRKAGLWWLRSRQREGKPQVVLHAVVGPDLL